jgi:ATP-binding cassette subfamily B (MDR/TAP) protein 7
MRIVKAFNNEKYEVAQYDSTLKNYEKASVKIATSLAALNSGQNLIFSSALTMMMLLAAQGIVKGKSAVGSQYVAHDCRNDDGRWSGHGQPARLPAVTAPQLLGNGVPGIEAESDRYGGHVQPFQRGLIHQGMSVNSSLEQRLCQDKANVKPLSLKGGQIKFENVSFGYHPDRPIFKDLSMTIPAGKKVAIVGPSGCGKSTVFRLLFRFYDSDSGRILIDGQDIKDVSLETLRKAIGVVPQDTPLFHADILHNVRYGNLDATDEEVIQACKKAQVDDTVQKLPEKYKTKVGERGLMISGGEKQRLAVARLLLKDPPILFFDEATSALDVYTETELMRNINTTLIDGTKTSVFIAHRLRTISDAGEISYTGRD